MDLSLELVVWRFARLELLAVERAMAGVLWTVKLVTEKRESKMLSN